MCTHTDIHKQQFFFKKGHEFEREQGGVDGHRGMEWFRGKKGKEEIILFQLK